MGYTERLKELNQTFGKLLTECPELTFIGDPILRQETTAVSLEDGVKIAEKLKSTLLKYRQITGVGRGLAAPQIGRAKAVFVTYINDLFKIYLNPKIIESSAECNFYRESCLSCGYLSVDVKRSQSVKIEYTDESGVLQMEELTSFKARLIQHEYDHLLGLVNMDKAEPGSVDFMVNDPLKEELRDKK